MNERPTLTQAVPVSFTLNGIARSVASAPGERLSEVVRRGLGLTGTKVGCNAGDCGACTVLMDGAQVCACMVSAAQADGRSIVSIEGLSDLPIGRALQLTFHRHDAAQCGICTPGMLMAAADVLARHASPDRKTIMDALGGVLCRCTGYLKIVDAILDAARENSELHKQLAPAHALASGSSVGQRVLRLDGAPKLTVWPSSATTPPGRCLLDKAVRSPHAHARFSIGDLAPFLHRTWHRPHFHSPRCAGRKFASAFIPTSRTSRFSPKRPCAIAAKPVLAVAGTPEAVEAVQAADLPIVWEPLPALLGIEAALARAAPARPRQQARQHPDSRRPRRARRPCSALGRRAP